VIRGEGLAVDHLADGLLVDTGARMTGDPVGEIQCRDLDARLSDEQLQLAETLDLAYCLRCALPADRPDAVGRAA
jgi:hypothetical protein